MFKALIFATAALAALAVGASAQAAERPRSAMNELKSLSDITASDTARAVHEEYRRDLVRHVYTPSDHAPWDNPRAVCAQPRNQYLMAFGEFMARHTRREPTDRFAPPELRSLEVINRRLRLDITEMTKHLPPAGQAAFLETGESLADDPKSWDAALRQRAEWIVALDGVTEGLAHKAHGSLDFGDNYVAGLWTRMACDFAAEDAGFLKRYAANAGAPESERSRKALELLQARTGTR